MQYTHYEVLAAAATVYSNRIVTDDEFNDAQQVLKVARQHGYRFNAYGTVISFTPEQMAQRIAADQIWACMRTSGMPV